MFRKSFVSVYFLPSKLLILQLSTDAKKVQKFASFDLPKGLIDKYKVVDQNSMTRIIKGAWSKVGIGEKSVGVILPEFSTFTKSFRLPVIPTAELNEAVRWQAQDYLPEAANMIMDWKIVEKGKDDYEVLVVAVEKEILESYFKTLEAAGLFPLLVETPSICLARLGKKDDSGRLVVYKNLGETILAIFQKERIIGSSVLHDATSEEIIKDSAKIVSHFSRVNIDRVEVCGGEITPDLIQKLGTALKKSVQKIEMNLKGFEKANAQEFIIPYSMQLVDLEQPMDPFSLNLLPSELVEKYRFKRSKLKVWGLTLTVTLFVWICFAISLISYLLMNQRIIDLSQKTQLKYDVSQKRAGAVSEVQLINQTSDKVSKISQAFVFPQSLLNKINKAKPSGVNIERYSLDLDKGPVSLAGNSSDRLSLITFKQNLEKVKGISAVSIPISNFEKETDLDFSLNFDYQPFESKEAVQKTQN